MAPVAGSSTLQIRPKQTYAFGGVSVTLRGNPVPISISLTSAQKEVDTRLDVRVLKRGPNAQAPIIDRTPGVGAPADAILMSFLDGVPPSDSKELRTSLNGVRAWLAPNGRMYLRTSMPVVSPAWTDSNASPDGMRAYAMPQVPSIMISLDGALTHVSIGE
jgi:intracellular multiplication protein IcmK